MNMKTNLNDLDNASSCKIRRNFQMETRKAINKDVLERSYVAKNVIKQCLTGQMTMQEVNDTIDVFFAESDYPTNETKRIFSEEMKACVERYITCEKRTPSLVRAQEITIFGVDVMVNPDMVFATPTGLEIVKIKYSKSGYVKQKKKGSASIMPEDSLEMYALLQYGRSFIKAGCAATVTASVYHLRKKNDSPAKGVFDLDFFDEKGQNVISLTDTYAASNIPTELDDKMKIKYKAFKEGQDMECNEKRCKHCDLYPICSFKKAPKAIVSENKVKKIGAINLTKEQAAVVNFDKGVTRINAGAGAGKTLVVSLRAVELMNKGVLPSEIALLTYTNNGANEMRERIQAYNNEFGTGCDISEMTISTFNSFGDSIIKKYFELLGFEKSPTLIDDVEKAGIIAEMLKGETFEKLDMRNFSMNTKDVKGALTMTKKIFDIMKANNLDEFETDKIWGLLDYNTRFISRADVEKVAELNCEYVYKLRNECLMEFADQELLVFELMNTKPDLFENMGIKHIIVDEYQDSNEGQLNFIKLMVNTSSFTSLMVVGDDDQSIFGFRNTSPEYIINFFNYIGMQGQDFYLLNNYRSTPEIIDFANKLSAMNKNRVIKSLIATKDSGKPVVERHFNKTKELEECIVEKIKGNLKDGIRPEDIAYIASTKAELLKMASLLREEGISTVLLNPENLIENSKVKAALEMVKAYNNPELTACIINFMNCAAEGKLLEIDQKSITEKVAEIQEYFKQIKALPELQRKIEFISFLKSIDDEDEVYEAFIETIERKATMKQITTYCHDFELYGENVAIKRVSNYSGVVLTTAHSSKGLEWDIVYNNISKYWTPAIARNEQLREEKRRLFFVSSTRAREELFILGTKVAYGKDGDETYNQFLIETCNILGQEF